MMGLRPSSRRDLIVLGLVVALLFALGLGARDLWNPNEPLYGQAVVEMDARGDWLVPRVNDRVFDEKPILYFWMALAASKIAGGIDEATLRLPSALSGVALVVLTYLLVLPYAGRRRAALAAAILATTYIVFWSARQVQMDLLLAACCLGAMVPVTRVLDHNGRSWSGWALAGCASGLGFLAKGPVGVVCPGLVVVAYVLVTGRPKALRSPALLGAAAAFLVVASPWYLWLAWRGEQAFLSEVLFRQNVARFIDPWDHQASWWYYLKYFWLDMAPWSLLLPVAIGLPSADEKERRLHRLAWVWLVVLVLFFSLSASKRSPYILPTAPALALLVASVADRWWSGSLDRRRLRLCRIVTGGFGLLLLSGAYLVDARAAEYAATDPTLAWEGRLVALLVALGGLALLVAARLRAARAFHPVPVLFGFVVLLFVFGSLRLLPAIDPYKSHRGMCEAILLHVAPEAPLRGFHVWEWRASYSYYTGRPVPNLESVEELRSYWNRSEEVFVVVERSLLDEARGVLGAIPPLEWRETGNNAAYLFSNRQEPE
jgi:4-amino-4-deoxy-L-arabinose transferase-like glycosyltransferase